MSTLLLEKFDPQGPFPRLSRRLRLGIVGGGRIAHTQATAARMTNYWDIVAGALSSDPTQAKSRGTLWHLAQERCYTSFAAMAQAEAARSDGVDAVMITTPNHLHYSAAKAFLHQGIDVLCDKPLTNDLDEARSLITLHRQSDTCFAVGYVMSCYPMIRQAREIVLAGTLGEIVQIHVEFMQDWMIPDEVSQASHVQWRLDPKKSGKTSCVGDIATHAAHLASFVSGMELTDIRAEFHVCGSPKPLEDTVFMLTRYNNDIPGTLLATRIASGNRGGLRLRIFGRKGGIAWDMEDAERLKLNIYGQPDQIISRGHGHGVSPQVARFVRLGRGFPEGLIEAWANLYTEFAIAIAARKDGVPWVAQQLAIPQVTEGAKGVAFIEAAVQSNQLCGAWVHLPSLNDEQSFISG